MRYLLLLTLLFLINNSTQCSVTLFFTNDGKLSSNLEDSTQQAVNSTNDLYIDRSATLLAGITTDYKLYRLTFKNISANLLGQLQYDYNDDDFGKDLLDWHFNPSINQLYISANAMTKYGSFSYSRSLQSDHNTQTSLTAFSFALPFKSFNFSFDYLKFTGLNRLEPVFQTSMFLKDITYSPMSVGLEYFFGRVKNPFLYIPKKSSMFLSASLAYSTLIVSNPGDFIPAIRYTVGGSTSADLEYVSDTYLHRFTSKGFAIGGKYSFIVVLIKPKSIEKPKSLYIKGSAMFVWNNQKFKFHSMSDSLYNLQYISYREGFSLSYNFVLSSSLVYDTGKFLFGMGGNYLSMSFGNSGSYDKDSNHARDLRVNANAFIYYRFGFEKFVNKVDDTKRKLFKKNKP